MDSLASLPASPSHTPPTVPGWAVPRGPVGSDAEAAFLAGAALNCLDTLVRSEPIWAGAWRNRLALKCAVAATKLAGRGEDEATLRDVLLLTRPGGGVSGDGSTTPESAASGFASLGPAGSILVAWRHLVSGHRISRSPAIDAETLRKIVELLGLRWSDDLLAVLKHIDDDRSAPFAAAAIAARIHAMRPDAELLGWWLADYVLAQKLRWPKPVPLLMAQIFTPVFRAEGVRGARIRPGEQNFERAVCLAVAQGAAEACRLAGEIFRRAERLVAITPKLRAKGAGEAIAKLLHDDAVSGSLVTKNLSRFASRRLFERLIEFEAVRELSGRTTFRIYGL